jgi:hypothetical protein
MDFITNLGAGDEPGASRENHKDKVIGADLPPLVAHQGEPHRSSAPDRDIIRKIYVMLFGEIN